MYVTLPHMSIGKCKEADSETASSRQTEIFQTKPETPFDPQKQTKRRKYGCTGGYAVTIGRSCNCLPLERTIL